MRPKFKTEYIKQSQLAHTRNKYTYAVCENSVINWYKNTNTALDVLTIAITGIRTPRLPALLDACQQQYYSKITQRTKLPYFYLTVYFSGKSVSVGSLLLFLIHLF